MKPDSVQQNEQVLGEWPLEGLEHVERCPVCGTKERHQIYRGLTDRVFRCAPGRWDLYQCEECRSAYLDPRPTADTLYLAYQRYYTHETTHHQPTESLPAWRRYIRALANGYRNSRYGAQLQPTSGLGPLVIPLFPRLRRSLDRELRYLPHLRKGARLLDVGFGSGEFMALARRVGWHVSGCDPDPVAVANAQKAGLDVRQGGIETFSEATGLFDVVTLSHVIEHVHDPRTLLKQAYDLLKPGGWLYIDTPNIDSYGHQHFKEHWRGLEIPRHLVLFNWISIIALLANIGFREVNKYFGFSPYCSLASQSRSIAQSVDPYARKSVRLIDVINEARFELWGKRYKTEFITLMARK